jgi:hypothetical protein
MNYMLYITIFAKSIYICSLLFSAIKGMQSDEAKPNLPEKHFIVNAKPTSLAYIDDLDKNMMPLKQIKDFVGVVFMEFDDMYANEGNLRYNNIFTYDNTTNVCKLLIKANDTHLITEDELFAKYLTNETKIMLLDAENRICHEYVETKSGYGWSQWIWGAIFVVQAGVFLATLVGDAKNIYEYRDLEKGEKMD